MRKSVLLTLLSFCYCIGIGIFNTALAFDTQPYIITHQPTYTAELKPMPSDSYQLAKATFLPDAGESKFSGYKLDGDYNPKGNCSDKNSLYTTKNCTYPKAIVAASQCPFLPGYYTDCVCLPKFKITSCNDPYILGGDNCEGKYEKCVCKPSVSMYYPNDYCTQRCEGQYVAKSCLPDSDETGCQYGTGYTSDGCGGTRIYCKACVPSSDETGCSFGTTSCSDGCGGTRKCCKEDPCKNVSCGTNAYCSNGTCLCNSGYEGNAKSGCTKIYVDPCSGVSCGSYAYCSNGACYCNSGYEGDAKAGCTKIDPCKNVTCGSNTSCSNGICICNAGFVGDAKTGCTPLKTCVAGGSESCTGVTSCSSGQVSTSSCKDCSGTIRYSCRAKTCAEKGMKDCNGSCIAKTECCGGCRIGQKCENGSCVTVATCPTITCTGYTLTSCPANTICYPCTKQTANCTR